MPLYDYKCPTCRARREILKPIADLDRVEKCLHCGFAMNRELSAPRVLGDYPGYECPITGKWVEGRAAHRENLAKHGCRILEPGETSEAQRRARQSDEALEESVAETAAALVENMPARQREQLAAELDNGLDVTVTRQGV